MFTHTQTREGANERLKRIRFYAEWFTNYEDISRGNFIALLVPFKGILHFRKLKEFPMEAIVVALSERKGFLAFFQLLSMNF